MQTKGFCKYCGKEYTRNGMLRHLAACKNRKNELAKEKLKRKCRYFQIVIYEKYTKDYWLVIETSENTTLKELDEFIREIWVECCGHMSAFTINGIEYESTSEFGDMWGAPERNMNYRLRDVADVGCNMLYEYDFGSTTELYVCIQSVREGERKNNEIVILSRNNPPEIMCAHCKKNAAKWVNMYGSYKNDDIFWCEECLKETEEKDLEDDEIYDDDEIAFSDMLEDFLPVCNSPRMGVCAYEGSGEYPDQFVPDCKQA